MNKNYLTFCVDSNICAVEISKILEVVNFEKLTPIPCAQNYIEGMIYSRGQGISVINLRKKFELKEKQPDKNTKIVVMEVLKKSENGEGIPTLYGLACDQVLDVIFTDSEQILSNAKTSIPKEFIKSILKFQDKILFELDFKDL